jgi:hypothetical protein
VLEQGAVGQANGQATKVFQEQSAHEVTPQGPTGVDLNLALCFGGNALESAAGHPGLEAGGDELGFEAALAEKLVDTQELLAYASVIDVAFDGGQRGLEQLLNGEQGILHELAYRLASLTSQEKKPILSKKMQTSYPLKVQAIRSKGQQPRLYVSFPLALAAAIGLEAGETVQWELLDRAELHLIRPSTPAPTTRRRASQK